MKNYRLGNIEVLATNLVDLDWESCESQMKEIGEGWRFPTPKEMGYMIDLYEIGVFNINQEAIYWVIVPEVELVYQRYAHVLDFHNSGIDVGTMDKGVRAIVRPVRDI
jgi:hypothetical protein